VNDFKSLRYKNQFTATHKIMRLLWEAVWLIAFRTTPRWAFHGWRRFLLKLFGARIGPGCRIAPSCRVWAPWNLTMGELSALGDGVDCYSMDKITIGSKVAISQRSFLCTGTHDFSLLTRPLVTQPIVIEDHVWISAETLVHPGVIVREGAVVGARSVVFREVPAWTVCAGNPCKKLKDRELKDCHD